MFLGSISEALLVMADAELRPAYAFLSSGLFGASEQLTWICGNDVFLFCVLEPGPVRTP